LYYLGPVQPTLIILFSELKKLNIYFSEIFLSEGKLKKLMEYLGIYQLSK
jgi:hypothetical protein